MARDTGFFQLRRGLWEHLRDGRMSSTEALAFIYIGTQADTRNGIWKGSAKSLSGELGIPERTARDVLEKMEHGDYIRRFPRPGSHLCYPILVHKFLITSGEHNGEQLNALESMSPADLAYFSREHDVVRGVEDSVEHGAAQKRSETVEGTEQKKTKAKPAAKTARPADPRFQQFVDFAYRTFEAKHRQKPTWSGKDFNSLKALLGKNQSLTLAELERRWTHYARSTEPFTTKQGDSLAYFCSKFDAFISGPIAERGKPNARDAIAQTIADSPLDENGRLNTAVFN